MPDYLLLRLEAPLQAWGDAAMDPVRPTRAFPSRSAIAGLLASALGWEHRDGARTTALQDVLCYAVREDRRPRLVRDYQTADLSRETSGWTRWGIEKRGGAFSTGTQILDKHYLADGSFLVAVSLEDDAPVVLDSVAEALLRPARPLFLGRKSCPPATALLEGRVEADTPYEALRRWPVPRRPLQHGNSDPAFRCWYAPGDGPDAGVVIDVWDRRDFLTGRFSGSRSIIEGTIVVEGTAEAAQ